MTTITLRVNKAGHIVWFEALGHAQEALQSQSAYDLVCAAVSALTQCAALGVTKVAAQEAQIAVDEKSGMLRLKLPKGAAGRAFEDAQIVLGTMAAGLEGIREQYPEFINIQWLEV